MRFCRAFAAFGGTAWRDLPPAPPDCTHNGVTVTGADLDMLTGRNEAGGAVWGSAWLAGTYAAGTLTVTDQGPPRNDATTNRLPTPPCPEPAGGWPAFATAPPPDADGWGDDGPQYLQPAIGIARRYGHDHPGEIVHMSFAHVAPDRPVMVLAVEHPDVVRAALDEPYGGSLCVVRSRYTAAQVAAAQADVRAFIETHDGASGGGGTISPDGQQLIPLDVTVVTPEVEAFVAAQPAGLFKVTPWLAPA